MECKNCKNCDTECKLWGCAITKYTKKKETIKQLMDKVYDFFLRRNSGS